jgi:hypothetical protein
VVIILPRNSSSVFDTQSSYNAPKRKSPVELYRVNVKANPQEQVLHVQSTGLGMLNPTTAEPPSQNATVLRPTESISNLLSLQEKCLPAILQGGRSKN